MLSLMVTGIAIGPWISPLLGINPVLFTDSTPGSISGMRLDEDEFRAADPAVVF